MTKTVCITGAFSYTGKYATRRLLERGHAVGTLTNHPGRENEFGDRIQVFPYNFERPDLLAESLRGATTLINTYWIRFPFGGATFASAVRNTKTLIQAAREAGVERIVHVSIANPSIDSPLGYYRGKAELEEAVRESGLSYAILRPTVIFGQEDILINNIAWFLRHFPAFGVPGDGRYGIQPIYVEDMAELMVRAVESSDNLVQDAVGPETFAFEELVREVGATIHRPARIVHLPAAVAYLATRVVSLFVGDVVLTWEEYKGLMSNLLVSEGPATGTTRLGQWLRENRDHVGVRYASEVARHFR